jgi:hypothetical protein
MVEILHAFAGMEISSGPFWVSDEGVIMPWDRQENRTWLERKFLLGFSPQYKVHTNVHKGEKHVSKMATDNQRQAG